MAKSKKPCPKGSKRIGFISKIKSLTGRSKYSRKSTQSGLLRKGSKAQVWHGTASKTSGGLTKSDLTISASSGKIVSRKQQAHGKKIYRMKKVQTAFLKKQAQMKSDPHKFRGRRSRGGSRKKSKKM